ncbi:MAG TPA: site-specific integrase, partial [Pedobacter sp.]|nr:site-specific integrase [Pedobacter sp.]
MLISSFLTYLKDEKRYSPHTLVAYETDLRQFEQYLQDSFELTKADATRALEAFFETVQKTLKSGEDVSVVGFGTF